MGKSSKSSERRARIEQLERERKRAERRRLLLFSGVVGVVALIIIGVTGWSLYSDWRTEQAAADKNLSEFGVPAAQAGCTQPQQAPASGGGEHIAEGPIGYDQAPPAAGPHRPMWVQLARPFYTTEDRPEVESLVHNLEHGYTILWYDETFANREQALQELENMAGKFSADTLDTAFIAAPWTSADAADEGEFPQGKHIALTHWYADPQTRGDQQAVTQYCAEFSGGVVEQFMSEYPQAAAPEGGVAGNL